jgi:serine/threonine protein phosphatase PrpC
MPSSGDGIRLRSSARTSVGQVRENNEDSVHLWPSDQFVLAVVADGMGGAAAGEEASRMAIEAIQSGMSLRSRDNLERMTGLADDDISSRLRESIQQANLSIMQRSIDEPDMRGMGTTVTLAFVRGTEVIIAHVGDSRAYQVNGSSREIRQITSDHSFVEALLSAGHITPEQALDHPMRNVLYRALGQAEDVDVDIYRTNLVVGDRLVLCSDGLTRHVRPAEIAELVLAEENPAKASKQLIDLANERGGEDNVSVIVILVERDNADDELATREHRAVAGDEEDTLVLKDKPFSRSDILNRNTPPETNADKPPEASAPLNKHKMQAERISDHAEPLAIGQAERLPTPYAFPEPVSIPSPGPAQPTGKPQDEDGEGHDTRLPEQ